MSRNSPTKSGFSHFAGQLLGLCLALGISALIASRLGASAESDAFVFGRRFFTSLVEALNRTMVVVFIPLFVTALYRQKDRIWAIFARWSGSTLAVSVLLTVVLLANTEGIVDWLAPNYEGLARTQSIQALQIFLIALPASILAITTSYFTNALGVFGVPSVIKQIPRIGVFATLLLAVAFTAPMGATAYAIGVYLYLGFLLLLAILAKVKYAADLSGESEPVSKGVTFRRSVSSLIFAICLQMTIWLETAYASSLGVGALTILEFAQRLGTLIPGMLTFSLVLPAFTAWCRDIEAGNHKKVQNSIVKHAVIGVSIITLMQFFVFINAHEIVTILLGQGRFDQDAQEQTSDLMRWLTIPSVFMFLVALLNARILADAKLPMLWLAVLYGFGEFFVKWILFSTLTPIYGLTGVGFTHILTPFFLLVPQIIYIWTISPKKMKRANDHESDEATPSLLRQNATKIAVIAALAIAGFWLGSVIGEQLGGLFSASSLKALIQLSSSGFIGGILLLAGLLTMGVRSLSDVKALTKS